MASIATPFVWAQRKDRLFISVNLRDLTGEKFELLPNSLSFQGTSDGKFYSTSINFFDEIDVEASKHTIFGFGARFVIFKKNTTASYWPRLTKEGGKHNNISFDWDRYIDSDEEGAGEGNKGLGQDWDPSMMQNFGGQGGPGGFGGPGGEGEGDSDDEEEGQGAPDDDDLEGEEEISASKGETKKDAKEEEEVEEKKE